MTRRTSAARTLRTWGGRSTRTAPTSPDAGMLDTLTAEGRGRALDALAAVVAQAPVGAPHRDAMAEHPIVVAARARVVAAWAALDAAPSPATAESAEVRAAKLAEGQAILAASADLRALRAGR